MDLKTLQQTPLQIPPPRSPMSTTPSTATATAAANATALAAASPPPAMRPLHHHHHPFPPPQSIPMRPPSLQPPPAQHPVLYPIASSGRGFMPAAAFAHRPLLTYHRPPNPHLDPVHFPRPPHPHHHVAPTASPSVKGAPKVTPSSTSNAESNGYKHHRDRSGDDIVTVRDRKVRIVDGSSLYALCRSWLRNGSPQETQQQQGDAAKSLPRPLPMPASVNSPKEENEMQREDEKPEDVKSAEDMSAEDLLKGHIKRAKKVRERLREERLKRIARYKTRLALLLPPHAEQLRTDGAAGN